MPIEPQRFSRNIATHRRWASRTIGLLCPTSMWSKFYRTKTLPTFLSETISTGHRCARSKKYPEIRNQDY